MYRLLIAVGLMASVIAAPAAAKEKPPLEPSSEWKVAHGHDQCSLSRHFGDEKKDVLLEITSFGTTNGFRFTLTGAPLSKYYSGKTLSLSLSPEVRASEVRILRGDVDGQAAVRFSARYAAYDETDEKFKDALGTQEWANHAAIPEKPETDFEEKATILLLKEDIWKQISLHTGEMSKPLADLRTCVDKLEVSWGLDPAKQKTLSRVPVPLPSTIKSIQGNYPAKMSLLGLSSFVPVRVMVDADGNASQCVIPIDGVSPEFKAAVCEGLTNRFEPARDADGHPTASHYIAHVIFYRYPA